MLEELPKVYAFIDAVGLPKDKFYVEMVAEWLQKGMTVEEALTQTCDGGENRVPAGLSILMPSGALR